METQLLINVGLIVMAVAGPLGVLATLLFGLLRFLKPIVEKQVEQAAQQAYAVALETHRAQLGRGTEQVRADLVSNQALLSILSTGYSSTQAVRVAAFEKVWSATLEVRGHSAEMLTHLYDLLLEKEYKNKRFSELGGNDIGGLLQRIANNPNRGVSEKSMKDVELSRPFVGENVWLIFYVHRAYCLGLDMKVAEAAKSNDLVPLLREYNASRKSLLVSVLPAELIDEQNAREIGSFSGIRTLLEQEMLKEMNRWIFGQNVIDLTLEQRNQLVKLGSGGKGP